MDKPGSARPYLTEPEQLVWANQARICKAGHPHEFEMTSSPLVVGSDVAKATLDVALRPSDQTWQLPDEEAQVEALVEPLTSLSPTLIVVEATGGLEQPLVAALAAAELPVVIINPRLARELRHSHGSIGQNRSY